MNIRYTLKQGVQVRDENFGLLFYNYRGPRLYFVPTEDLIAADFFNGKFTQGQLIDKLCEIKPWPRKWIEDRIIQVLTMLENRELIYGEPIC